MSVLIAKADGVQEPYDPKKLLTSLRRSGAEDRAAEEIAAAVERTLYNGITTGEIYRQAFARLREYRRGVAARYSLKRAVLDFGPSGFPFESYVAELYRAEGFKCAVDQIIAGACVEHEVDIVIKKEKKTVYTEAKFHNTPGFKTDLKTVLYVKARIDDIRTGHKDEEVSGLVITNTKFTSHAAHYAECQGLALLGWDTPSGHSLHDLIQKVGLYPITALTTLNQREKKSLLEQRVVLCNHLSGESRALGNAGVTGAKATAVLEEVGALCVPGKGM